MKKKTVNTTQPLDDQAARERIRTDLDTTLIVEAAAGTGKTSALVGRILSGVMSGRLRLANMVAMTFTEFAAGELKLRLRSAIEEARHENTSDEVKSFLIRAVEELEEARIGTIHSFCSDLLREHPVEAGIDPLFEVAPDDVTYPLFTVAFERWFERQLANAGEGVRRILRRPTRRGFGGTRSATLARRPGESGPKPILRNAAWELIKERDFTAEWKRPGEFDRDRQIDELVSEMRDLGEWSDAGKADQWLTRSLAYLKQYVSELTRLESLGQARDYDGIEASLFSFLGRWRGKDWKAYYGRDNFPADDLRRRRDELKARVQKFVDDAGADLAPRLRTELWEIVEDFEQLKERAGYLDFLDLLLRARNLVRDNATIRKELHERFTHIFVDEFQDTDPLQAEILMLLGADNADESDWRNVRTVPGKLFIVGDPKQSIYRFRRADVALYQEVKRQVISSGGALVDLNVSFRSVPEIQQAVNAAFEPVMCEESMTQAKYVPLAPCREGIATQPAIVALPVSQPYGDYGKTVDSRINESMPLDVAGFISWLINESGWTVTERGRPGERISIEARHVCLLFRRLRHYATDVTRPYVEALESHRIPHLLVGGSSFHSREEIEATRNALTAVEWPDDELAIYATLRGPLFAFTDSQLLSYRTICSTLHPFKQPPDELPESLAGIVDALSILRSLHRQRNQRPIAETIQSLLSLTRAHAGFANWSTGEQALANLSRLTDMARRAERNGLISFRAFVDWLDDQAEHGDVGDAPIMEEGVDGVRIMTVHKAKGLEFPVVILCDITAKDSREPSKWIDQTSGLCAMKLAGCLPLDVQEHSDAEKQIEKEEAARVLYVAATRARDLLVVCAVGDKPYDGWLATISPVLYPSETTSFNPESREPIEGVKFGHDNVISRPNDAMRPMGSVSPGLHRPIAGSHHVVWWDPTVLPASIQGRASTKLTEFLREDESRLRATEGIRAHEEWQAKRGSVRATSGTPTWNVLTASSQMAQLSSTEGVKVERIKIDFSRPHGKRFGSLVHNVLSITSLTADVDSVTEVARLQGRILGATQDEVKAAVQTVIKALDHKLMRRAAKTTLCRREVPVSLILEEGTVVEGKVDLAFKDSQTWTIVDYKTDFEIAGRMEEYVAQVGLYAEAVGRATGCPTQAVILQI